jgi:hypothetical protein
MPILDLPSPLALTFQMRAIVIRLDMAHLSRALRAHEPTHRKCDRCYKVTVMEI